MTLRHIILFALGAILLAACNMTLAADVTPPPGYVPPTPVPTLGPLFPNQAPDVENGKAIYAAKCAACHGQSGLGDGEQSKDLPVSVIPIGLPEFSRDATPAQWYAVVTQGNLERFMPPFNSLSDQERWDVVSYALTLHVTNEQIELGKTLVEQNCADCAETFANLETMSALSEDDLVKIIREGNENLPAFGSGFSEEEAYAAAAFIRALTFAPPPPPAVESATQTPVAAEAGTATENASQPEGTQEAGAGVIKGQIENRSGEALPSDIKVTLHGFDHGADPGAGPTEFLNEQGAVNADGSYIFETTLVENQIYIVEITVNGIAYKSAMAVVPAAATELTIEPIVIHPVTDDIGVLKVEELQIYFDLASEEAQIFSVYFIRNDSDQTLTIEMRDGQTIPFISFPEGAAGLGYETTDSSAGFVSTESGFALPPNEEAYGLIAFASIPKSEKIKIVQPAMLPIGAVSLYLPEGVSAEGDTLTDGGIQDLQGANFHVYTAAPVEKGGALEFTLSGKPATVTESPDITQNQTVLIGVGGLGIALIAAGVWMYLRDRKNPDEEDEDDEDTFEDAESNLDAIIALDDLRRAGKIGDEAYKKRREELMGALKRKG